MDNPLKKFIPKINPFKGGGGGRGLDSAIGIDIGSSSIKIVEVKKKEGKASLETYGSIALGPYADVEIGKVTNLEKEKLIEAIKELLTQSGTTTKNVALAIPIQSSLVFTITLPANLKEGEMDSVVLTEARKYIPVPMTEVSVDHFLLPTEKPSYEEAHDPEKSFEGAKHKEVLVVATQNEVVSKMREIITESELSASFFEVEIFSSIRSNLEHELSLAMLVDFGAARTKVSIIEFGMVKAYHTIDRGSSDMTESIARSLGIPFAEAEKMKKDFGLSGNPEQPEMVNIVKTHLDYIFSEINNALSTYEKKHNEAVTKIVFSGGGSILKGLKETSQNYFKAEVEIGTPFDRIGTPAFLEKALSTTGPEFAVAIGLALRKLQ